MKYNGCVLYIGCESTNIIEKSLNDVSFDEFIGCMMDLVESDVDIVAQYIYHVDGGVE